MLLRDLDAILAALGNGDTAEAAAQLAVAEWRAFERRERVTAGELGYARWRLSGGDVDGALAVLRALVSGRGPSRFEPADDILQDVLDEDAG